MSASSGARRRAEAADVAREGRTDANRAGIVRGAEGRADAARARSRRRARCRGPMRRPSCGEGVHAGGPSRADGLRRRVRRSAHVVGGAASAASPAYATDEREADRAAEGHALDAASRAYRSRARRRSEAGRARRPGTRHVRPASAAPARRTGAHGRGRPRRRQRTAAALKARAISASGGVAATARAAGSGAAKGVGAKLVAALAPAAAPVAWAAGAVLAFVLVVLAVSQLVSALFGFWTNEDSKRSLDGLPPYITYEMVEAALECQEEYGHPAGCTIAQIICESGVGDSLSGLAEQDNNLFGIKWSVSFAGCPEVEGSSEWGTSEEVSGESVQTTARFTRFRSHRDCIVFRSRVLLQNERYAGNALIQRAIEERDSDLMAEGLKDAGYATDSAYVEKLKAAMDQWGLRALDDMTVEDLEDGGLGADAIVSAARTQLGVPYVWGGTTPGVGLDCSGLTQWCYAQAGISIPRTADAQMTGGEVVPLSSAIPGDILWRPGHVAIYVGGDSYIHAPKPGDVVREASGIAYFTCAVRYR